MTVVVTEFKNRKVAVIGLGKSGCSVATALAAGGAEVWAWDDSKTRRIDAAERDIPVRDAFADNDNDPSAVILSPGVPHTNPTPHRAARMARERNIPVLGDVELLYRAIPRARYVGVTGTNGKSTTTALIGHILKATEFPVEVGGNLGTPPLDLEPLDARGVYVLELSSYQLDLVGTTIFDIAVLLNISPDHLDRHGGLDGYIAAKSKIFDRQGPACATVIGIDDPDAAAIAGRVGRQARVIRISATDDADVFARKGMLIDRMDGQDRTVMVLADASALPGRHNVQNIAAAYAVCRVLGMDIDRIVAAISGFPGLPHRMQQAGEISGVRFVNDSKATNAAAAAKALACYGRVYWIAGGREKQGGYEQIFPELNNVRAAFLVGEAAVPMASAFGERIPCHDCGALDAAIEKAFTLALGDLEEGGVAPVVLLSPACASFDQFTDFEARGEAFLEAVGELREREGPA